MWLVSWGRYEAHQGCRDRSWLRQLGFTYRVAYSNRSPQTAVGKEQAEDLACLKGDLLRLIVVYQNSCLAWWRIPFVAHCSPLLCSGSEYFVIGSSLLPKCLPCCNPLGLSITSQQGHLHT